jgi:hypothetical protein
MLKRRIRLSKAIFYASYNLRFFDAATADLLREMGETSAREASREITGRRD